MSANTRNRTLFGRFARWASCEAGRPTAFSLAVIVLLVWAVSGPIFGFSDTWQLIINTGTTIITFLMVFLIQNTQNRDSEAIHVKLDELIRADKGAHNALLDLEELEEEELNQIRDDYEKLAEKARSTIEKRKDAPKRVAKPKAPSNGKNWLHRLADSMLCRPGRAT